MSIAIVCLVTWLVLAVFAIVPKRFTLQEMVFLYFVSSVLTVTVFTVLDLNLHWVPASHDVEKALALNVCRFIEIPPLLIMAADLLNSPLRARTRWAIAAAVCLFLVFNDWILLWCQILVYRQWNSFYAFIDYGIFIIVLRWIARWFVLLDKGGIEELERRDL